MRGVQLEFGRSLFPGTNCPFLSGSWCRPENPLPRRSVALAQPYGKELAGLRWKRVLGEEMTPFVRGDYLLLYFLGIRPYFAGPYNLAERRWVEITAGSFWINPDT